MVKVEVETVDVDELAEAENESLTIVQGENGVFDKATVVDLDVEATDDSAALAEILAARKREDRAKARHLAAKEEASDCKKAWEAAVEELTETIDRVTRPLPLFDGASKTDGDETGEPATTDDSWKSDPLGVLNLDDNVEVYLAAAGYSNLGELSAYMAAKGDFWAKDLSVGGTRKPGKMKEKVEDGFAEFWAKRG